MRKTVLLVSSGAALVGLAPLAVSEPPPIPGRVENARVAQTMVNTCAGLRQGECVLVTGGARDLELLELLCVEARKQGAHPLFAFESDRLTRMMYTDVPPNFDTQEPAFAMKLADTIDAVIMVDATEKPDLLNDIPPQRILAHGQAFEPVDRKMRERGVVSVNLGNGLYPTKTRADQFNISQDALSKLFWKGVNTDYTRLQATGEAVKSVLAAGQTVRITGPNGTDLTVQIARKPVFVSDGVVSQEDRYAGGPACQVWLPAGEVYVTPVSGTANGTFVADNFFFRGQHIEGFRMNFSNGKLTSMSATRGDIKPLQQLHAAAPGGRDDFAAIDIGINRDINTPSNSRFCSWMGAGTISVGFGGNAWAGGDNACPFDCFAHLTNGTLSVDNKPLVEKGRLMVGQ